ncbi:MAG TPA: hypothetical protein VEQ59_06035 [Polyangiaceae bacterium]|nr:hypothetical protein [Polyangiaceae bacterium]
MTPHEGRALLSTMIQGSTVDLFQTWGIAVAPVQPTRRDNEQILPRALMAGIHFNSPSMQGSLGLLVPKDVFELVKQDASRPFAGLDWVQENVNQLLGRLKSRLLSFQVTLNMGLPHMLTDQALQTMVTKGVLASYRFRTLRGEVGVTMTGRVEYARLEYRGVPPAVTEGDVIVF